jgi:CRISPR system Cascade subunit CasE
MNMATLQEVAFRLPGPLTDLQQLHRNVWQAVRSDPDQTRNFIFAFTETPDDISIVVRSRWLPSHLQPHVKPVAAVQNGNCYRFKLRANPVRRRDHQPPQKTARPLLNRTELQTWLQRVGDNQGFIIEPDTLALQRRVRRCTPSCGRSFPINDVLFRGELRITDNLRFHDALETGIGRSKAFGYGMLMLLKPV